MSPQEFAALFSFLLVFVVVGFLLVTTYNSVVTLAQQASKAWANIDVALKQRHDELPNLVEAVKGLMAFERATLLARGPAPRGLFVVGTDPGAGRDLGGHELSREAAVRGR